jgi:hypothetical protein
VNAGQKISLGVGVAALGGAAAVAIGHGAPLGALFLALVGASALSGFVKSRREPQ